MKAIFDLLHSPISPNTNQPRMSLQQWLIIHVILWKSIAYLILEGFYTIHVYKKLKVPQYCENLQLVLCQAVVFLLFGFLPFLGFLFHYFLLSDFFLCCLLFCCFFLFLRHHFSFQRALFYIQIIKGVKNNIYLLSSNIAKMFNKFFFTHNRMSSNSSPVEILFQDF